MFEMLKVILITVGFAILIFVAYMLLSRYVFSKIRVNKWILLAIAAIFLAASFLVPGTGGVIDLIKMPLMGIAAILFFWFFDVHKDGNPSIKKAEKKVVIKSKAKPNRVKNNKK
ncbi:hypothetical protein [uncultured Clostridium sp.]|uniref:hypothetical protein n=1 Tax=uncultured Clostridium sp. TaxID=59620 RepID=UPI00262DBFB0|nr:hypothetical protein [uncultured Clostridium sp.]